jgi:hypothetical protein
MYTPLLAAIILKIGKITDYSHRIFDTYAEKYNKYCHIIVST